MSNVLKFEEFLLERKNVGVLYHYTTFDSLIAIVTSNQLGDTPAPGFKSQTVSLTREKNFHKQTELIPTQVRITVNGTLISDRYKIKPYQFHDSHFSNPDASWEEGQIEDQFEESVTGPVKDAKKYVTDVVIDDRWFEHARQRGYIDPLPDSETNESPTKEEVVQFVNSHGFPCHFAPGIA